MKYDPDHKQHVVIVEEIQSSSSTYTAGTYRGASGTSISDELAELARLHQNGDLSDDEFERAKKKLLG